MTAHLLPMPTPPEDFPIQLRLSLLLRACDELHVLVATVTDKEQAFRIWRICAQLEEQCARLSNAAAGRIDDLQTQE